MEEAERTRGRQRGFHRPRLAAEEVAGDEHVKPAYERLPALLLACVARIRMRKDARQYRAVLRGARSVARAHPPRRQRGR